MTDKELCRLAVEARGKAYAPYSGYRVGAALLAKSGEVYLGSNIENAAYTPTVCAERTAFFKAVSEGETEFFAIAVAGGNGDKVGGAFPPCGVCRQVMAEFCDGDFKILTVTGDGTFDEYTLTELLPLAFSPKNLERK
ncbi:MAG: cytidine deaminase [Clostridia bacterium]|nr:cytidine deaminase [Clostridia bacterium]